MSGDRPPRSTDFRTARISAAAALIGVLTFILIFDALSPAYEVNDIVVTVMLGAIGTLLGIEGLASLRQGPTPPPHPIREDRSPFDRDTADPPED